MFANSRRILWVTVTALILAIPLWKPLLTDFLAPPGFEHLRKEEGGTANRFVLHKMKFTRTRGEKIDATVLASRAYGGGEGGSSIIMQEVDIVLYKGEEATMRVTSGQGTYQPGRSRIILPGDFTVTGSGVSIKGKGLYYNLNTGNYRIENGVSCKLKPA